MVVFWIPNSLTSLANFSFSLNILKTCPWWYATFNILFLSVLIISSYRLFLLFFPDLVPLQLLCLNRQLLGFRLWSLNLVIAFQFPLLIYVLSFYYLPSLSRSVNEKISTIVPNLNLKQKSLSRRIFYYLICIHLFFFTFFFSWVSKNLLLAASKTAKAILSCFFSILITRACCLIFYFGAPCFKKYLKLSYTHSWYMIPNMIIGF